MATRPDYSPSVIIRVILVAIAIALAFYVLVWSPAEPLKLLAGAVIALAVAVLLS